MGKEPGPLTCDVYDVFAFIAEVSSGLDTEVNPGDRESLMAVMGHIRNVRKRMKEMDDELETLTNTQSEVKAKLGSAAASLDENSVYIGQVDYEATAEELRAHFAPCGTINRITIPTGPRGNSKGFAYIEFASGTDVENALKCIKMRGPKFSKNPR